MLATSSSWTEGDAHLRIQEANDAAWDYGLKETRKVSRERLTIATEARRDLASVFDVAIVHSKRLKICKVSAICMSRVRMSDHELTLTLRA